jgi:hypothetical protein
MCEDFIIIIIIIIIITLGIDLLSQQLQEFYYISAEYRITSSSSYSLAMSIHRCHFLLAASGWLHRAIEKFCWDATHRQLSVQFCHCRRTVTS